jgi:uncharacterized integral membrane protein
VLDEVVKNLRGRDVNLLHTYFALPYIIVMHLAFVVAAMILISNDGHVMLVNLNYNLNMIFSSLQHEKLLGLTQ